MFTLESQLKVMFSSQDLFKRNLNKNKVELAKRLNLELVRFKTQDEAAKFLGTNQPVVSNIYRLKLDNMSLELILEYLSKFEINIEIKFVEGKLFFRAE